MKNKISKIILIASLFATGLANSQEFYTCVPKKNWVSLEEMKELLKTIKTNTPPPIPKNGVWKEKILLTPDSIQSEFKQTLQAGKYKVTAAGAGTKPVVREFILNEAAEFKACAGLRGEYGGGTQYDENVYDGIGGGAGAGGGSGIGYNGVYSGVLKKEYTGEDRRLLRGIKGKAGEAVMLGSKGGDGGCCSKDSQGSNGSNGGGYGKGYAGKGGKGGKGGGKNIDGSVRDRDRPESGKGGYGCYSGGGGGGGAGGAGFEEKGLKNKETYGVAVRASGGGNGGSGGSYFGIDGVIELLLKGADRKYDDGEEHDGFVKIEKWE